MAAGSACRGGIEEDDRRQKNALPSVSSVFKYACGWFI